MSFLSLWNAILILCVLVFSLTLSRYHDGFNNSGLYSHEFPILSSKNSLIPCPCEVSSFHLVVFALFNFLRAASISSVPHDHCRRMDVAYFLTVSSYPLNAILTALSSDLIICTLFFNLASFTMFATHWIPRPPWLFSVYIIPSVMDRWRCNISLIIILNLLSIWSKVPRGGFAIDLYIFFGKR